MWPESSAYISATAKSGAWLRRNVRQAGDGETIHFQAPTSPISTVKRTIYRQRLTMQLASGDTITLHPLAGWLDQPVTWVIPPVRAASSAWLRLQFFGAAVIVFLGLLSLAFTFSTKTAS
jgi:hypothetical protein